VQRFERINQGVKGIVPFAVALEIGHRPVGQCHLFSEGIAWLQW
jgi:hypothetical protein